MIPFRSLFRRRYLLAVVVAAGLLFCGGWLYDVAAHSNNLATVTAVDPQNPSLPATGVAMERHGWWRDLGILSAAVSLVVAGFLCARVIPDWQKPPSVP